MANRIIARLVIVSDVANSQELQQRISMNADRCWNKGDLRPHTKVKEPVSGWLISNEAAAGTDVNEVVTRLVERVANVAENIAALTNSSKQISIIVYSDEVPSINVGPTALAKVADLGASLDIDLYLTQSDPHEE